MFGMFVCMFVLFALGYFAFALMTEFVYRHERKMLETETSYHLTEMTVLKR